MACTVAKLTIQEFLNVSGYLLLAVYKRKLFVLYIIVGHSGHSYIHATYVL